MATYQFIRDDVVAFPAFIDCHVHFREPGLEHKADMQSEATAAYHGGISAVCDMPNTIPPTQSIAALADKVERAKKASCTRIFFFFGATAATHLAELERLWTLPEWAALRSHCCGLKLYLDNSTGDLKASDDVTEAAFELCARLHIPLVAHCEHAELNAQAAAVHPYDGPAAHSRRRPAASEVASVEEAIARARRYRTPLHIAHLSTAGGLAAVRRARAEDPTLLLTCEVAPHHLFLDAEDYCGCGARVKVNPPMRTRDDREALWEGLLDGAIDCVATDHAPHTAVEKQEGENPPSGMPAVEVVVPLLLTVAAGKWPHPTTPEPHALRATPRRFTYDDLVRVMHTNPNRIFSLNLGTMAAREFNVNEAWRVEEAALHSKCGWSPYNGWRLIGKAICRR